MRSQSNAPLLAIGSMAASAMAWDWPNGLDVMLNPNATNTCDYFKVHFPSMTIMPTDCNYTTENEVSWNAGNWLGPTCVLTPSSPEDLSCAVKTLVKFATPFAMRGGGHMTITDAANINSTGILISSTNLLTMELSKDKSYLSVAPGRRWGDTYVYLDEDKSGKMVVGGRYSPVGIPGYLLGGGMSFFSYEYGFSSTNGNVKTFECVLADGSIVEATVENEYSDLYWALQGGGNSFCLLTKFELRTIDSPSITLGNLSYGFGDTTKDQWLSSVLNYVLNGSSDPKAAITPVARYAAGMPGPRYDATLFYNGNVTKPAILNDFQGGLLPGNNLTTLIPLTMSAFAKAVAPAFEEGGESQGLRQRFYVVSHKATREAMDVVHETFFDGVIAHNLTGLSGFFVGLAWNSITTEFIAKSNSGIGCPQGIPEEPVFWVEEALTWGDAADDAKIEAFVQVVNANITAQLTAMDASPAYIYLNDADGDQDVFGGYPPENVQCLKSIRDKYDPLKIFTNLMPGGFKVAHA